MVFNRSRLEIEVLVKEKLQAIPGITPLVKPCTLATVTVTLRHLMTELELAETEVSRGMGLEQRCFTSSQTVPFWAQRSVHIPVVAVSWYLVVHPVQKVLLRHEVH